MNLCECGCGKETTIMRDSNATLGYVKGAYHRFVLGHRDPTLSIWNKGLTADMDKRIKRASEETKKKMILAHKKRFEKGAVGSMKGKTGYWKGRKRPEEFRIKSALFVKKLWENTGYRAHMRNAHLGKKNKYKGKSLEEIYGARAGTIRANMSLSSKKAHANPKNYQNVVVGTSRKGYFWSDKNNCDIFYASSYELTVCMILEKDGSVVRWGRCHYRIMYVVEGVDRSYAPDFFVEYKDGVKKIIESKSIWEFTYPERRKVIECKKEAAIKFCLQHSMIYEIWTETFLFEKEKSTLSLGDQEKVMSIRNNLEKEAENSPKKEEVEKV